MADIFKMAAIFSETYISIIESGSSWNIQRVFFTVAATVTDQLRIDRDVIAAGGDLSDDVSG